MPISALFVEIGNGVQMVLDGSPLAMVSATASPQWPSYWTALRCPVFIRFKFAITERSSTPSPLLRLFTRSMAAGRGFIFE